MQPWTDWIINVKITFSTESNKLPMIWLSERFVARIRETPGSRGAMSYPPWVIDSCTVLTFWSWCLREPGPVWSTESVSSGWVPGPHSELILGDLCPEHRAVVNPQLSDLEILIAVLMWNSGCWELLKGWLEWCFLLFLFCFLLPLSLLCLVCPVFLSHITFGPFYCPFYTFSAIQHVYSFSYGGMFLFLKYSCIPVNGQQAMNSKLFLFN